MSRLAWVPRLGLIAAIGLVPVVAGCQNAKDQATVTPSADAPPVAAPRGPFQGMADADGPTDDHAIRLKLAGLSSAEEMTRDRARLDTAALKNSYEMAFRLAFAARVAERNYPESARLIGTIISAQPEYAPAYRVLGYALFNMDRGTEALAAYKRAVAVDPNYGEAHYALAFLFAMGDRGVGREHFEKAMELGIKDERNLEGQFYPRTP